MVKVLARSVLWYVVFVGFGVNYMVRINANIAIVSMVLPTACRLNNNISCHDILNVTSSARIGTLQWNEYEQSLVLGSFFWLHWVTQLPGGMLARKYGPKLVFGLSNLSCGLLAIVIPWIAHWSFEGLVILRVTQGVVSGFAWPAMHHLTAHWIPPTERGKFVSAYMGSSIGTAITYPLFGLVIDVLSWEYVFYLTAVITTIWYFCWLYFVYDKPASHPRISPEERLYIEGALGPSMSLSKRKMVVPWKQIFTSVPLYLNILVQVGGIWSLFTCLTHAPTYFRFIHGWDNKMTGLLSGIPHLCRFVFALVFGMFTDWLLKKEMLSPTNVRKLAAGVCSIGQGIFVIGLAFSGRNSTAAIVNLILATMCHGAVSAGPLASMVELSPNFASLLLGYMGMMSSLPLFLTSLIVGIFTNNNQTPEQWTKVFLITAAMLITPAFLYILFGNSDLQPWNEPAQYDLVRKRSKKNKKIKDSDIDRYK